MRNELLFGCSHQTHPPYLLLIRQTSEQSSWRCTLRSGSWKQREDAVHFRQPWASSAAPAPPSRKCRHLVGSAWVVGQGAGFGGGHHLEKAHQPPQLSMSSAGRTRAADSKMMLTVTSAHPERNAWERNDLSIFKYHCEQ